jgi:hypothetical protein
VTLLMALAAERHSVRHVESVLGVVRPREDVVRLEVSAASVPAIAACVTVPRENVRTPALRSATVPLAAALRDLSVPVGWTRGATERMAPRPGADPSALLRGARSALVRVLAPLLPAHPRTRLWRVLLALHGVNPRWVGAACGPDLTQSFRASHQPYAGWQTLVIYCDQLSIANG